MTEGAFASSARDLLALGYHPLPVMPAEKAPGEFVRGAWRRMSAWQRFRDRAPSPFELDLWSRGEANVGLVLGTLGRPGLHLVAIDIDIDDADAFDELIRQLPPSPMRKRGAKGETRFYLATRSLKSRSYSRADRKRLVDVLTGFDARQTVVPPSLHATTGKPYLWLAGPVAAATLPEFGEDDLTKLEEALQAIGWADEAPRRALPDGLTDPDDFWAEVKTTALGRLDDWVPALDLTGCRRARGGYEAVATWRASSSGRPIAERKRNLSIQRSGIRDFGTSQGYSAIDLVMASRCIDQPEATTWLRERLGLADAPVFLPATIDPAPLPALPATRREAEELPDELTRPPGLLGAIVDWICATARRPQRGLALGAALTVLGTAAGRKYAGPTRTGTQLYVLGLARSSAGKDHPLRQISRLLTSANMTAHIGPGEFMSLSAVVKRLARQPLTLCAMDEFGSFLSRINNRRASTHEQAISGMLRGAWGASFQTLATPEWAGHDSQPIHTPALSIFGVSTPEEFYAALSGSDLSNGFLNRFLLLSTRKRPAEREPEADPFVAPESIRQGLMRIYGSGGALVLATLGNGQADGPIVTAAWADAAARKAYVDLGRQIEAREAEGPLLARTVEMAQRLATIRAIGCFDGADEPIITVADMEWGRDVALWSAERMIAETVEHIAETQAQADAKRVLRAIREKGIVSHRDLARSLCQRNTIRDLRMIIEGLADSGEILVERVVPASGGTPTIWYRAP